jgi:hypothetical protein
MKAIPPRDGLHCFNAKQARTLTRWKLLLGALLSHAIATGSVIRCSGTFTVYLDYARAGRLRPKDRLELPAQWVVTFCESGKWW